MPPRRPPLVGALTVWQPYASALLDPTGKDVENRGWALPHTPPVVLAIHAGARWLPTPLLGAQWPGQLPTLAQLAELPRSAHLGVVTVTGSHRALECGGHCSPWATRTDGWHWTCADPRPLPRPLPSPGWLRIWQPTPHHRAALAAARPPRKRTR